MAPDPRPGVLVGRARELAQLRDERRRSEGGQLRVALVLAGPGLGKTRLAAEMQRSGDPSTIHLAARISGLRPLPPFDTWTEVLHRALWADGTALPPPREAGKSPERPAEALVRLLRLVNVRRPVTMTLDDVHQADDAVWEMLLRLAQDHPDGRVLVVATARPRQLTGRAAIEVLAALEQDSLVQRIELRPLDPEELRELAATATGPEAPPPSLVDWLAARSQGNPRVAFGLLEAFVEEGGDPQGPSLRAIPPALVRWVLAEVARVDPPVPWLLDLLAVVGGPVDPGDLAQMAERPAAKVAAALEGLLRAGLVTEHEQGRTLAYRISHPLVGDVLYSQVSGATRRVLHRRVAGTLLASGRCEAAASHFIRSARAGDAQAIDALIRQLAEAGRRGSHAEVWAIVPPLVDLLPSGDERWLDVSDALSWPGTRSLAYKAEHYTASEMGALLRIQEQLATAGDLERQASIRFRRAGVLAYGAGDKDSGQLECRHAQELSRQAGREHEFRMAAIELAKMRGWFGDVRGQETAARQLLAEAEEAGDQRGIVAALGALGVALGLQGRFAEAEAVLLRSVDLAPSTELSFPPPAVGVLGVFDVLQGHVLAARARWSQATGASSPPDGHIFSSEVFVALLAGDLATVRERGQQAKALDPGTQLSEPPWLVLLAAIAAAESGKLADARRGLELAARDHRGDDLDIFSQFRRWGEGVVAWAEDRPVAATRVLEQAVGRLSAMHAPAVEAYLLADLVEVAVAAGDRDTALTAVARSADIAREIDAPSYQALHQFGSAWALLAGGDHAAAATAASSAVDGLGTSGLRLLQARARVAYATAVRVVDRREAAEALDAATASFDAAGAVLRRERARRLLAQLGSSGRRAAARFGAPALTEREQEIATLAARGLTARQIADGLHIGVRTVETHLARIYPKLGVTSKQQLISRGGELGLVPRVHESGAFRPDARWRT